MGRLIDADVLREYWLENGLNEYVYDTNSFLESIDEQPTVEVDSTEYQRLREGVDELAETLEELRDANGNLTQADMCKFILDYMWQIGLREEKK